MVNYFMAGKDRDMSNTECSELFDLLKRTAVKTTELVGNTETTAYFLYKSFASDTSNNSLNVATWL